jgi:ribosomal protein L37E
MFGKKSYKAKFLCRNCGAKMKVRLRFGVMPVSQGRNYYLFDIRNQIPADSDGRPVQNLVYLFCTACGSYELCQYTWGFKDEKAGDVA